MEEEFHIPNDIHVSTLARCPEVLTMEQTPDDEEHLWEILSSAMEEAAEKFVASREIEGEHLKHDLLGKLDYMTELVDLSSPFSADYFRVPDTPGGKGKGAVKRNCGRRGTDCL